MPVRLTVFTTIFILFANTANAQWFYQKKEDPFGDEHVHVALTVAENKFLAIKCEGKNLMLTFAPNQQITDATIAGMNAVGGKVFIRIDKEKPVIFKQVVAMEYGNSELVVVSDIDKKFAGQMANARSRIAAMIEYMGFKAGKVSFGVRGSRREIMKVVNNCK